MCMRKAPPRHSDARGFLLTELAVSLPIFVLLLTFLAFALAWSWRSYQQEVADAELRQEMHIAAARIVESALLSDYIRQRQRGIYEMRRAGRIMNRLIVTGSVTDGWYLKQSPFPLPVRLTVRGYILCRFRYVRMTITRGSIISS